MWQTPNLCSAYKHPALMQLQANNNEFHSWFHSRKPSMDDVGNPTSVNARKQKCGIHVQIGLSNSTGEFIVNPPTGIVNYPNSAKRKPQNKINFEMNYYDHVQVEDLSMSETTSLHF
ncbi:hypothetical protein WN51_08197 [Melipona quadrifasciata]|uniref:Uncharacterized protein n=1 Tax=Melipona quadrifasciata TaxID=166423 RepID=A0A0M9A9R8_9HYME|nr:hypothetical protein WN51_08197 [Melipona quadrifasciata]